MIFYNSKYYAYEEAKINEFEIFIQNQGIALPPWWDRALSLKLLQTTHMGVDKVKKWVK